MGSRRKPLRPAVMAALTRAGSEARAPGEPAPQVVVDDHLEPRVRIPADLLRCVIAAVEIAVLVGLALLANATGTGLEDSNTTVMSLLITIASGSAIGSGLRYALGTISGRPTAADIAASLGGKASIVAIRRVGNGGSEFRRYAATTGDGGQLDVTVF